ncbi:MAG TPA: PIN domain-containing protein [Ilumatobacteraceae bacterium]|nr:PIN domain-containing protein [Ilumatobacteraceae bacterium]
MLLIDTGIFVAVADRDEPHHNDCAALLRTRSDLAVTATVIPEAAWLIEARLGPAAEARFLTLVTSSRFTIVDPINVDYQRAIALIRTYTDLGLGFVDASIIAIAEHHGIREIATLNHRDFAVVRPAHCEALDLVP